MPPVSGEVGAGRDGGCWVPLGGGEAAGEGDRSALVIGGTEQIRSGDQVVFLKVVAVAPARVRRDGRVQAQGSPCSTRRWGRWRNGWGSRPGRASSTGSRSGRHCGPSSSKGTGKRLLARAFVIRVIILMTLVPDADAREVIAALAGDLAMVPWARAWRPASPRAFGDWRNALGPEPLEELQDIVLRAAWRAQERDWRVP